MSISFIIKMLVLRKICNLFYFGGSAIKIIGLNCLRLCFVRKAQMNEQPGFSKTILSNTQEE